MIFPSSGISSLLRGEIIGWGCGAKPPQYNTIYLDYRGIFFNLLISKVIINTLMCNPISVIAKNSSLHSRGCRHTAKPHKRTCVYSSCFSSLNSITIVDRFTANRNRIEKYQICSIFLER